MTTTHKALSPSKAHRWRKCPGSVREEAAYPEERSGAAAIDGTHTHTLLAQCIDMAFMPASGFVGLTLSDHDGEFVVDADRAERVQFALDYVLSRGDQVVSEEQLSPAVLLGRDDLGGTIDVQIIGDDWIEVADYKDGMAPVTLPNDQLEQYVWCVLAKFSAEERKRFKRVIMTIIQPKLRLKGSTGIVSHEMTIEEFMPGGQKLIDDAKATEDPNAPLVAGDHCTYCRHKACTARTTTALAASGISFSAISDVTQQAAGKDANTMSDQQLREIIEAAPLIRQTLEAAEAEAKRRMEAGTVIEGLKLVRGRGSRGWLLPDADMEARLKKFGLPKDVIWQTKLISVAQAEKARWKKRDGTEVQLSEKQLKLMQSEYVTKTEGALTVASVADDRPAVVVSAAHLFGAVTDELPDFLKPLNPS